MIVYSFSEELSRLIQKKKASINQVAKYTGIDHSTMYKIMQGKRRPSSMDMVMKIGESLCLNQGEMERLKESYYLTLLGPDSYYGNRQISDLISSLSDQIRLPEVNTAAQVKKDHIEECVLNSAEELQDALIGLCSEAGDAGADEICLFTSGNIQLPQSLVNTSCRLYPEMKVYQICVLDDSMQVNDANRMHNLDFLRILWPLMTRFPGYHVSSIYADVDTLSSMDDVLGDFVLTQQGVCVFDRVQHHGFITHSRNAVFLYHDVFQRLCDRSQGLMRFNVPEDLSALYGQIDARFSVKQDSAVIYSFNPGICSVFVLDENETVMEQHIDLPKPYKHTFISAIHAHIRQQKVYLFSLKENLVHIATVQGIRYFVSQGYINELHSDLMSPLTIAERIQVLRKYRQYVDEGIVSLIDNPHIAQDSLLVFECTADDLMVQLSRRDGTFITGSIKEASIVSQFYRYCEFSLKTLKLDHDKAVDFLDVCIETLSQQH